MFFAAVHESAFGPKRTSLAAPHMSAFGGKADMAYCGANVRLWPKADIGVSLNAPRLNRYDIQP
jgi:hypothetical protein